ncbi:MAG: hypothetical protein UHD64_06720 [Bacteroidales bacterium]|nr:hypothetical protein [Bacteroidales bacterium]
MGRPCPLLGTAVYLDCVDCDDKQCNRQYKYKKVVIGIDQSYNNTGISIAADGKLVKVRSIQLDSYKTNSDKRRALANTLNGLLKAVYPKAKEIVCIIERIRLRSQGFLNIDYIKSIGALNSIIVDMCSEFNIPVYSVDTRCWKAQVIGTSKPMPNKYGVPEEKWPTVRWLIKQGWEDSILIPIEGRKTKGTFTRDGQKYMYNNDAADSAGIAMFGFLGDQEKLQLER